MNAEAVDAFRAIGHPIRREILDALRDGEQSVNTLCERFHVSQPAVSQHLAVLRDAGLVRVAARGRQRHYALDPGPLREVFDWASHYERFWNQKLDALSVLLDRRAAASPKKKSPKGTKR